LECAIGTANVGRYDDAIRLRETDDLGLPAEGSSLGRMLKEAGYATALCGKWHLGYTEKFSPSRHGFDHAFYCLGGGMDYYHYVENPPTLGSVLRLNGEPLRRNGYFTDLVAEDAIRFIEQNSSHPFFLYVPFTTPHAPFQAPGAEPAEPLPADSPLWQQSNAPPAIYTAMVESLDAACGRILAALQRHKLAERTLVIFMSDNGGTASARPTPFSGIKGSTLEGGIRVPCIVRWPGVLPAGATADQAGATMDLTVSMVSAAGARFPPDYPPDGIDILRRIADGQPPTARTLFWRGRRGKSTWSAVRDGWLKFVVRQDGERREAFLYDLQSDQGERMNLLAERPADAMRLERLLASWANDVRPRR
jgi:N-acetylgalactosamine-6-sulfatase